MDKEFENINIAARPWTKNRPPRRILAIRLQAMGDVIITLPYLQHLRSTLPPSTELHMLTRKEYDDIPKNISLFHKVFSIGGGRSFRKQLLKTLGLLPKLLSQRYDVVIDLQNNDLSQLVRKTLNATAWTAFDRFSPNAAGDRTRLTIEAAGLGEVEINSPFHFKNDFDPSVLLRDNGWDGTNDLVVLNPAGAFPTRNWPLENYVSFAELWLDLVPSTQFLTLGTSVIREKANYLKKKLDDKLVCVIDKTTPVQAFAVLQKAKFMLSEDSGLMHMAWVSGVPTLALFGATRSDWSRPLGDHTFFLDSSDLPCGNCMQEICAYGDTHCLSRFTPEFVFEKASSLSIRSNFSKVLVQPSK